VYYKNLPKDLKSAQARVTSTSASSSDADDGQSCNDPYLFIGGITSNLQQPKYFNGPINFLGSI
jgi:hypothetical protein